MTALVVDVWSDFACPWCSVGERRLEAALARLGSEGPAVVVRRRAFELDPGAPRIVEPRVPYAERLARKYGAPLATAEGMVRTMTETAAAEGLAFRFDLVRPGNTFDAHRLARHAAERGRGDALHRRLFAAYLGEGAALGDHEVLVALAREVGLDGLEARAVLDGEAYADAVRADEAEARARGIQGVPTFLVDGAVAASGAQPPEVLLALLQRCAEERGGRVRPGPVRKCGPDGCN